MNSQVLAGVQICEFETLEFMNFLLDFGDNMVWQGVGGRGRIGHWCDPTG